MRGSWKLTDVAGIGIYVHWSFLILPALVGWSNLAPGGLLAAVYAVLMVLAVFFCVALHELGHALAARRYGIHTRDITLLPIGGLARLERMPRKPSQEFAIALAGPATNVVIATALFVGMSLALGVRGAFSMGPGTSFFLVQLMWANVALAVFNLLPAFPMDGGRVLRATLAMRFSYLRATEIAAGVGQAMAVLLGIVGLLWGGGLTLLLVAMFVFLAARAELAMVRLGTLAEQAKREWFDPGWRRGPGAPGEVVEGQVVGDRVVQAEIVPDARIKGWGVRSPAAPTPP